MGLPTPGTNQLQVLRAVEDGWQAFCRAPWPFLLFQVLALVIAAPFAALVAAGVVRLSGPEPAFVHPIAAGIAVVVGVVGYVVVALWGVVGLVRGAWLSLEGQRPVFRTFTRWDGAASGRLLLSTLLLAVVVAVLALIASLIGTGLGVLHLVPGDPEVPAPAVAAGGQAAAEHPQGRRGGREPQLVGGAVAGDRGERDARHRPAVQLRRPVRDPAADDLRQHRRLPAAVRQRRPHRPAQ